MPDDAYENAHAQILAADPGVREFSLVNQNLSALPPEISGLTALQSLDISHNQLTALPPEITSLTALHGLYLGNNQLTALPPEIARLTALQSLYLGNNQLTALPPEIANLTALRSLDLHNNEHTALPPEIANLTALESLDLRYNQLTTLPPEIAGLTALQSLYLGNNQLTALLPEITSLTALQSLDLSNNQLRALPPGLGILNSLERAAAANTALITEGLFIEGNPLPDPYPSLIAPGQPHATSNVLAYLRGEGPDLLRFQVTEPEPQPTIPPPRPAAIRVSLTNNRLTVASTPSPTNFNAATMRAAIAALKASIADLLADATADTSNFDRRALAAINRAQERLPKGRMSTIALFQLAHLQEALDHYAPIVADQWPDFLAAQFAAMRGNLALVVAHFPEWQVFKNTQPRTKLSREQAEATPSIAQSLAEELRTPESQQASDPSIPEALEQLAELPAMAGPTFDGDEALDLLAPDILESINNILKPIAAIAMGSTRAFASLIGEMAKGFGKEARKGLVNEAKKGGKAFAPWMSKWAKRILTTPKWGAGAVFSAATLAKAYPETFAWLEPVLALLRRLL